MTLHSNDVFFDDIFGGPLGYATARGARNKQLPGVLTVRHKGRSMSASRIK